MDSADQIIGDDDLFEGMLNVNASAVYPREKGAGW